LRAERVVRRRLPSNLRDGEAALFAGELERLLPPSVVRTVLDVHISADGLLFKGSRILCDSFPVPLHNQQLRAAARAKLLGMNFLLKRRRQLDRKGLWITDTWSIAYFHWLTDALSRLHVVADCLTDHTVVLPERYLRIESVAASLAAFGVDDIEVVRENEFVRCRELLLAGQAVPVGEYDEDALRGVRQTLLARYGATASTAGGRVYVSRRLAQKRRIINEDAVIETLRARGFQVVHAETMPFEQQVRLFSTASFVVGNHGGGLTNMLFMPPHGRILELRHNRDAVNNCYFTLAAALGLEYLFLGCSPAHTGVDPHFADIVVDPDRLADAVDS
jgi:capsular polysaccharide biosynthesis protein